MNSGPDEAAPTDPADSLGVIEAAVRSRYRSYLRDLTIERTPEGLILHGRATSYFGKQMAQEEILREGTWPIVSNRIVVSA
jgi:hypothetical protein